VTRRARDEKTDQNMSVSSTSQTEKSKAERGIMDLNQLEIETVFEFVVDMMIDETVVSKARPVFGLSVLRLCCKRFLAVIDAEKGELCFVCVACAEIGVHRHQILETFCFSSLAVHCISRSRLETVYAGETDKDSRISSTRLSARATSTNDEL
jgi:hypothetical protein